jgi:CRISPR-associated protein Cas8a1/Csx13
MARELSYGLHDPNFTIYHRAALGGLAASIQEWGENPPEGINHNVSKDSVRLWWGDELSDQEAVRRILEASFKLTEEKLIDLPGQCISENNRDLRIAIHNGLCLTFLQHNKMRPGEKEARTVQLKNVDQEIPSIVSYKALNSYAHQKAQGTKLLDESGGNLNGSLPKIATIPQSVIPGAMTGGKPLQASADEAILLLFLMVSSSIFILRPRTYKEKIQACIVVPDVANLHSFCRQLKYIASAGKQIEFFTNTYLDRIVGGAEEAALRFLIDYSSGDIASEEGVSGCLVVAMGKVAWDKNQINRSMSVRLHNHYDEMAVFRESLAMGKSKFIKTKTGESFPIPGSPVPELIAANLASDRHWCTNFRELVSDKKDFDNMQFLKGGLSKMSQAVKDTNDQVIIQAFHQAWSLTMGELSERAKDGNLDFARLLDVRREKMRNEILRAKTSEALANWFLRFCCDATSGRTLAAFRQHPDQLRSFLFSQRNFERIQNLLLFALVSYTKPEKTDTKKGDE